MKFTNRDLQARLASLGYNPGPIDGIFGSRTRSARDEALKDRGSVSVRSLFGKAGLSRIHWHWTAGADGLIAVERRSYNGLIDREGNRHPGDFPFEAQADYAPGRAASHTLNCNSTAGGLSLDCMAGAQERPFDPGTAPMTWAQVNELVEWTADLCLAYDIPVSRYSTLSHSEVQPTLGVRQRWKWDINWLPDMGKPGDPIEVGDRLREMTSDALARREGIDESQTEKVFWWRLA